jgi:hypothetical protein
MRAYSLILLLLAVTGCAEGQGAEGGPTSSLEAAFANGEAPSSSCSDLLVEWASLVPADLKEVEPPSNWDLVQKYEAANRTWSCLPKGSDGRGGVDKSIVIGLTMMRSDGPGSSLSASLILFEQDLFDELGPCGAAWATADLFVSAEEAVEEVNREIDDTTWACSSVDEWWLNLKKFPEVFGVSDYPDSDRWSPRDALQPSRPAGFSECTNSSRVSSSRRNCSPHN